MYFKENLMKCMHCLVEFHDNVEYACIGTDVDRVWLAETYRCAACGRFNLFLVNAEGESVEHMPINQKSRYAIYPRGGQRRQCSLQVPADIAQDYFEASLVFDQSRSASAALSRIALQKILRHSANIVPGELAEEILDVLDSRQLPAHMADLVKAVLTVSDFYKNPLKSQIPGAIQPTVPAEAELLLEVLDALLDFYYIQPTVSAGRWAALKAKMSFEGKPLLK